MKRPALITFAVVALGIASIAAADDKEAYDLRISTELLQLFQSLDRDGDAVVTPIEAAGDVNFLPQFADIDTNRDGSATLEELMQFIERSRGVRLKTP